MRHDAVVHFVQEDRQQRLPDVVARLVVRHARLRRIERLRPVVGGQRDAAPRRLDAHRGRRRLLVERDSRLDRGDHLRGGLQLRDGSIRFGPRGRTLRHQVAEGAGLDALLAEPWQHVLDVGEIRLVRTHDQHAAVRATQTRVRVEQVRGAVKGDHGLAGARPPVDDEGAA